MFMLAAAVTLVAVLEGRATVLSEPWHDIAVLILGSGGWAAFLIKTYFDWKKERRAQSAEMRALRAEGRADAAEVRQQQIENRAQAAERRAEAAETRAADQHKASRTQLIAPYVTRFNQGDLLRKYDRICELHGNPEKRISQDEANDLRGYAAELERIGTLMMLEQATPDIIYKHFGEEIIKTRDTPQLWENENMQYWKTFERVVEAMRKERSALEARVKGKESRG